MTTGIVFGISPPGPTELILILAIVVIFFGVGKLPEVGGALGKGIRNFRKSVKEGQDEASSVFGELEDKPDIQDAEEKVAEKTGGSETS